MTGPELLASWVSDAVGLFDPAYAWHALAQGWQADGVDETDVIAQLGTSPADRTEQMIALGLRRPVAEHLADAQNADMGGALLRIHRSARQPVMSDLGRDLPRARVRPGLALLASEDHYVGSESQRRRSAARAGACIEVLDGLGHWWMAEDPVRAAAVLTRFWAGLAGTARDRPAGFRRIG